MKDNHKADVSHTDEFDRMYQEMVKQAEDKHKVKSEHPKTEEGIGLVDNLSSRWVNEFELPNDYIFKDENGNAINATKIVLEKKKEYPKTYEECCDVLSIPSYYKLRYYTYEHGYNEYTTLNKLCLLQDKLNILGKLIICRDAYWKIAGEEMGLGKPWEPDFDNLSTNLEYMKIVKGCFTYSSKVFVFPTAEMRDAFYENFKEEIESVKELL